MEAMNQSSGYRETLDRVQEIADKAMKKASRPDEHEVKSSEFVPEFKTCETHGRYQINFKTESGVRFLPGHCPVCFQQKRASMLLRNSNITKRFSGCDFDNYVVSFGIEQEKVLNSCRAFADDFEKNYESGSCLLLCGRPGTGKNHLATAICKQVIKSGRSVLRIKASQFLEEFWGKTFDERGKWIAEIAKVDLVFIDEIGRSSETKNAQDAFFRLIDARYEAVLPTIIATNLNRKGLVEVLGEATFDRLKQGGSIRLTLDWESYRSLTES